MKRLAGFAIVCVILQSAVVAEDEKVFSGPQKGELIAPFKVLVVNSPDDVQKSEIIDLDKRGTVVIIFMHKLTEPAIGLMIAVEWYAGKQKGVTDHYVYLSDDQTKAEQNARRWAENPFFASAPMCISVDGPEGPGRYGLNRKVDMTVLIAKNNKVVGNFALLGPNQTDAPAILASLAHAIDQEPPSFEKLTAELRSERTRKRAMRMKAMPVFKLAPNEPLARLMITLVQGEDKTSERAKHVAGQMREWAGDDKEKQAALKKYAKAVLGGDFELRDHSRKQLQELAGE